MKTLIIIPVLLFSLLLGLPSYSSNAIKGWDAYNNGDFVTAFKEFIKTNHEQQKMPLYSDNKKLYVYLDFKWECCKDDEIKSIIQDIWRKFLQYIMSISATYENQDEFDILRMKVMKMRQTLSDVEKTRKSILKWLIVEIAQPQ